ncbi:Yersinia protein of uncharacterised function (DUF3831) [Yersinia pseudotuberculosis]|nr:Yersinia protein of uncharacterised function (DUF3831) [Yersinia pseudotuberculosis]
MYLRRLYDLPVLSVVDTLSITSLLRYTHFEFYQPASLSPKFYYLEYFHQGRGMFFFQVTMGHGGENNSLTNPLTT